MDSLLGPELAKARTAELVDRAAKVRRRARASGRARRLVGRGLIRIGSRLTGASVREPSLAMQRRPA
jgi:hypothetical protein